MQSVRSRRRAPVAPVSSRRVGGIVRECHRSLARWAVPLGVAGLAIAYLVLPPSAGAVVLLGAIVAFAWADAGPGRSSG